LRGRGGKERRGSKNVTVIYWGKGKQKRKPAEKRIEMWLSRKD